VKCLIIAAGEGQRLRQKGESKPLTPLLGIPLIERVIQSMMQAGVDDFYVVTGYRDDLVNPFLLQLAERLNINITTIHNDAWQKQNGISVLAARDVLHAPFLLTMTDHVCDPANARALIKNPPADGEIALATDGDVLNHTVDLEDVTRVQVENGNIRDIGKGLSAYNAFDTGIFLCTPAIFNALEQCRLEQGGRGVAHADLFDVNALDVSLSDGVQRLAAENRAKAVDVAGKFWIDVDDPIAFWRAENALTGHVGVCSDMTSTG